MVMTGLIIGFLTALGILIVLFRTFSTRLIGRHTLKLDILISLGLMWFMMTTITGIISGVVAGIIVSAVLTLNQRWTRQREAVRIW